MVRKHLIIGIRLLPALLSLIVATTVAAAQDNPDADKGAAEVVHAPELHQADHGEKNVKVTPETPSSDPTKATGRLKQLLTKPERPVAIPALPKLPDIALRGLIKVGDKPASAILEIEGKRLFTLQANSQVSIKSTDGRLLTLKIIQVSTDGVEIEIPELKEKISLR